MLEGLRPCYRIILERLYVCRVLEKKYSKEVIAYLLRLIPIEMKRDQLSARHGDVGAACRFEFQWPGHWRDIS